MEQECNIVTTRGDIAAGRQVAIEVLLSHVTEGLSVPPVRYVDRMFAELATQGKLSTESALTKALVARAYVFYYQAHGTLPQNVSLGQLKRCILPWLEKIISLPSTTKVHA